jgi:hypothetical protein
MLIVCSSVMAVAQILFAFGTIDWMLFAVIPLGLAYGIAGFVGVHRPISNTHTQISISLLYNHYCANF